MSTKDEDLLAEQQRVDRVVDQIGQQIDKFQDLLGDIKSDIVDIRKNFWHDVTVNLDEPDDVIETHTAIRQQAEVLSEKERNHQRAQSQLKLLTRLYVSPYFGRIDFRESGESHVEQIYLGIGSFRDALENFLVYDWRAPISSLYYDYPPGPAEYQTPMGAMTGELDLKRQYIIRDARIASMFDTGVTIGDELLQAVLGKQSDAQMKSIVATIQREQNQIIRNERSRLVVVQGAAGSGKTSAALQRIAYLLYRYRDTLRAENIMLFSPNPMFNSYVSTVLPELGEENMQQTTFQEYLEFRLGKTFQLEDPFTQLEYVHTEVDEPGYQARMENIRYKASTEYVEAIDAYVLRLGQTGMKFKTIRFRGETIVSADRIEQEFYRLDASWSIPNRMKRVAEWLVKEVQARAKLERSKPWVEDEIELLEKEDYLRAFQELRRKQKFTEETFDDLQREQELLSRVVVKQHFKPMISRIKHLRFVDVPAIYKQFFQTQTSREFISDELVLKHWNEICQQTVSRLNQRELAYEDATPYLYLKERIEGFQTNTSVRHVFIDEAQDYSPFQFTFIKRLFPQSKLTVLGDLNQLIYAHGNDETDFGWLLSLYGADQTDTFVLQKSYRSTRQIVEFTREMVRNGSDIEPFNRNGRKPTIAHAGDPAHLLALIEKRIEAFRAEGHRTIAIICKTVKESQETYDALRERTSVRLIHKETASFEHGVIVIPSYLAKGVEFDAVIIYNGSKDMYGRACDRKLLYTACTRAMHELYIYYLGDVSPFIATVPEHTYIKE